MGNVQNNTFQQDEDDQDWEVIEIEVRHPKVISLKKPTADDESLFIILDDKKSLFREPLKIKQTLKKYPVSKRILELQNRIGGEVIFGYNPQTGPIQFGKEPITQQQQLINYIERPINQNRRPRKADVFK